MEVKVITHQGEFITKVDVYNATDLENKLNQREFTMVSIGDIVVNRNSVTVVIPMEEVPAESTVGGLILE